MLNSGKYSILLLLALSMLMTDVAHSAPEQKAYRIGVLVWQKAEDYEATLRGLTSKMNTTGIDCVFDIKQANGDIRKGQAFIQHWKEQKVDLILTLGTRASQLAVNDANGIPVVFATVLDPVKAGVVNSLQKPAMGATGVSAWISAENRLAVFSECVPTIKTLGVVYNSADVLSYSEVREMSDACKARGIVLKESLIEKSDQIDEGVNNLIKDSIDALWIPIDEMVYRNMTTLTARTIPAKLPVFSSTIAGMGGSSGGNEYAMVGATADFTCIGQLCVPTIVQILKESANAGDIPVMNCGKPQIVVNLKAAEAIGYQIPPAFLAQAAKVLNGYAGQSVVISGTGDSQELLRAIAQRLTAKLGEGQIHVPDSIGSGGGIKALLKGEADLARVARPLKTNEKDLGLNYLQFGTAPIVFVVHPDVTGIDNVTPEQILDIYSGRTRNWGDLGARPGKIYPITREAGDSCLTVLAQEIRGFADVDKQAAKPLYTTQDAIDALSRHSGTIGFVPLPVVAGNELRILKINGIYPSIENVQNGIYPYGIPLALVYKNEPQGLAERFVEFLSSSEGKDIMMKMGVAPVK